MKKKLISLMLIILTLMSMANICHAISSTVDPTIYDPSQTKPIAASDYNDAFNKGGKILEAITNIGMVVAVVMILIIGIKYMMGSVEQRAEYKKTIMLYLIGAFLLFGSSAVVKMIYNAVPKV